MNETTGHEIYRPSPAGYKPRRRFSTVLMGTIIALVTVAVAVILVVLNGYFSRRADVEFQNKLKAQKGQVELLINNRLAGVESTLKTISLDNTVRVTVMLGSKSQLSQHLVQTYSAGNGAYFIVQNYADSSICPQAFEGLPADLIRSIFRIQPRGGIIEEGPKPRLLWLFSAPISHKEGLMGTAYALYDIAEDATLIAAVRRAVEGDLASYQADAFYSLLTGQTVPLGDQTLRSTGRSAEFVVLSKDQAYSKITAYENLYFLTSLKPLNAEKRRVTLLMSLFSALVLFTCMLIASFFGRRMVRPLREMTRKAIQISEGQKELQFENTGPYWEFDQLSEAFNYMLTNLKNAEERSRYKELLENVDDAVYIVDGDGKIIEANASAYSQLGYPAVEFFRLELITLLPEADARRIMDQLNLREGDASGIKTTLETVHRRKDGSAVPVEIQSRPILYRTKPVILNVARNISRRVEAEKALRESEERYRSVVENSSDGVMILDDRLKILFANRVLSNIVGYPIHALEFSCLKDYLTEDSPPCTPEILTRPVSTGNAQRPSIYQILRKDGDKRTVRIKANPFKDSNGQEKLVAQVVDITDRLRVEEEKKQLEAQLNHAQKLEAIGTLAGGIAHDFNNLLMGIQGRLSMIRLQSQADQSHFQHIEPIEKTIQSAADLTKQLLGFARKGQYEIKLTGINTLVEESTCMFISTRKEINLRLNCHPDVRPVKADRGQIEQVLINLYVNAWQAMPGGGDLTIATENKTLSGSICRSLGIDPGDYVKITVTDSGEGMDRETVERIFEPFFTTKGVGKGTGLGLASAYGIIKNHRGAIQVDSRKGRGTSFSIYLPAADSDTVDEPVGFQKEISRGKGKILVVDDEKESIEATQMMMKELGYDVIAARSGEEALRLFAENRQDLELITLDMIMPGMNGKETFDRLKRLDPDIRVLLISGYSQTWQADEIIRQGGIGLLQKPFDIFSLSSKLKDVMAQR